MIDMLEVSQHLIRIIEYMPIVPQSIAQLNKGRLVSLQSFVMIDGDLRRRQWRLGQAAGGLGIQKWRVEGACTRWLGPRLVYQNTKERRDLGRGRRVFLAAWLTPTTDLLATSSAPGLSTILYSVLTVLIVL